MQDFLVIKPFSLFVVYFSIPITVTVTVHFKVNVIVIDRCKLLFFFSDFVVFSYSYS